MKESVKLTQFAKSAGCAAKIGPKVLAEIVGVGYSAEQVDKLLKYALGSAESKFREDVLYTPYRKHKVF